MELEMLDRLERLRCCTAIPARAKPRASRPSAKPGCRASAFWAAAMASGSRSRAVRAWDLAAQARAELGSLRNTVSAALRVFK